MASTAGAPASGASATPAAPVTTTIASAPAAPASTTTPAPSPTAAGSVVDQLLADNEPVTFTGVARAANVSHWLVYADGVREHIEAARRRQERGATNDARTGAREPAGWKVEKQLLQEDNRRLWQEVERLKDAVRRSLGQQLDQIGAADLGTRVDELTAENQRLQEERDKALAHVQTLTEQLSEVQDDLGSARLSLRQMIRTENQAPSPGGRQSP